MVVLRFARGKLVAPEAIICETQGGHRCGNKRTMLRDMCSRTVSTFGSVIGAF